MGLSILKTKVGNLLKSINKTNTKRLIKDPIFWARFFGYAIPLAFLLYVLYINYLPFGYDKAFIINVGSDSDTKTSEFYLEPSANLSDKKITADGKTYRELNGMAQVIFKPNVILKDATITVSTEDEGVYIIPPEISMDDIKNQQWDYSWDFTKEIPKDLTGNAFMFDGCGYFNGKSRLELPNSFDQFESGAFSVYAEWIPRDGTANFQQIVGHYNWELLQEKNQVRFNVGRMNNPDGSMYAVSYVIKKPEEFFNQKHSALAIYNPDTINSQGYIELYIDGLFAQRTYFKSDVIFTDYNTNRNLSFGKSGHGAANFYNGCIYNTKITNKNVLENKKTATFKMTDSQERITVDLFTISTTTLSNIQLHAVTK